MKTAAMRGEVIISQSRQEAGERAAQEGAALVREAVVQRGQAFIILATGTSQLEMLAALASEEIAWPEVTAFHLDEYLGLPGEHPASFRRYLKERFADKLPLPVRVFHYIDPGQDPQAECLRLGRLISAISVDVAFVGVGENGHLAFNDPPADFETDEPYLVVTLDERCRRQQFEEGWFKRLEAVPWQAISMSVRQIMRSRAIICTAPGRRKAEILQKVREGLVTPEVPASILQQHPDVRFFLDKESASQLRECIFASNGAKEHQP